ncbi:pIIIa [red squirrel adenovirus 1]|uniref:Pre-hexon-linking protein IIIa n=1 Tax=red squirrel adenovirus 1 TaxID=2773314 RepID=A0A220A463_9ADEN|nr:pIIIa [red squirrel adenovirus 1]ARE31883.1 pIIIa [red squirrel adenovirus 1]WUG45424.1 pIIIa [Squirrel mastadenovirus A]
MNSENPASRAAFQGEAASSVDWDSSFRRIMALTASNPQKFASQPRANRFDAILEATIPSRKDPTHQKILSIVNALVQNGAVRPDEAGQMYNALLERVSRYNSTNLQTNLDRLVQDVRQAVAIKERTADAPSLASIVTLNAFYNKIPAHVPRGQDDYMAFLSALKMLVSEVPQTDVYQSGPHYFFSTSRNGSQTVNLSTAFENLQPLWGVMAPVTDRASISSILTPNTRLLLLIVAPFTDYVRFNRDSYIGHLLTLYREAIGTTRLDEATYNEITSVSRALGHEDGQNLQATLNFLLTNKHRRIPRQYTLSADEERALRYIQQSVALYLMQDGATPSTALDLTSANLSPSFYARHRDFINRLMDYLRRAALLSPNFFTNAVMNSAWLPPEGFFTGDFDFPEQDELDWDDVDSNMFARMKAETADDDDYDRRSLSELGAAAPRSLSTSTASFPSLPPPISRSSSSDYIERTRRTFAHNTRNEDLEIDNLVDRLAGWKTYAQTQRESNIKVKKEENGDDSMTGTGHDPFKHLRPRGKMYL